MTRNFMNVLYWLVPLFLSVAVIDAHAQFPFGGPEVPENPQTVHEIIESIKKIDDVPSDPGVVYTEITNANNMRLIKLIAAKFIWRTYKMRGSLFIAIFRV
jgi:hypothetical protein